MEPSKRKNAGAELAHKAQVRLNTGAVLTNCHQISTLLPARAIFLSRIGAPRVYTTAVIVGGRRKARPPGPADATLERQRKEKQGVSKTSKPTLNPRRAPDSSFELASPAFTLRRSSLVVEGKPALLAPLTLPGSSGAAQAERESGGVREIQTHALSTPRAETFLKPDSQSHRAAFFSLGPCTARSLFGKTKKRMGGADSPRL